MNFNNKRQTGSSCLIRPVTDKSQHRKKGNIAALAAASVENAALLVRSPCAALCLSAGCDLRPPLRPGPLPGQQLICGSEVSLETDDEDTQSKSEFLSAAVVRIA